MKEEKSYEKTKTIAFERIFVFVKELESQKKALEIKNNELEELLKIKKGSQYE